MNIALVLFCVLLMILGTVRLCRFFTFRWTKSLTKGGLSILVRPQSAEECEVVLRAAVERLRWLDCDGPCEVLCLNPQKDPEIDKVCRLLALHFPAVRAVHFSPSEIK